MYLKGIGTLSIRLEIKYGHIETYSGIIPDDIIPWHVQSDKLSARRFGPFLIKRLMGKNAIEPARLI